MSYQFEVKGTVVEDMAAEMNAIMQEVVDVRPKHYLDREIMMYAAASYLQSLGPLGEGEQYRLKVSGTLSNGDRDYTVHAGVSITVDILPVGAP